MAGSYGDTSLDLRNRASANEVVIVLQCGPEAESGRWLGNDKEALLSYAVNEVDVSQGDVRATNVTND